MWADWKAAGYEVIHGSKALFRAVLIWASHGDGKTYTASFFGASQVQPYEVQEKLIEKYEVNRNEKDS